MIQQMDWSSHKGQRSQRGFTLIELIVALQVGFVIGLMAVPNVKAFFARYQLLSASNQLGFDIARARMQAVGHNRFVRIKMASGTQYTREESADGSTWSNQVTTKLPKGVTSTTASAEVRFDRRGFAAVNNSIVVSNSLSQRKTVATTVVGRVSVSSETG